VQQALQQARWQQVLVQQRLQAQRQPLYRLCQCVQ
jgi:hypothetical protein